MKTDNKNSEKDLNANPDSRLNTHKTGDAAGKFPEGKLSEEERRKKEEKDKKDADIELLASEVRGSVSSRDTGSSPGDIAGVSDLDNGMQRAKKV